MFIAVEGIDGSGKSSTVLELEKYFKKRGREVVLTSEPTKLASGVVIRDLLAKSDPDSPLIHEMLTLAFAADRINHLREIIWPALKAKKTVITDRYFFSSLAYQSLYASYEWVKGTNRFATLPDVLVFVDSGVDTAVERLSKFRASFELYEKRRLLEQIDKNYRRVIADFKESVRTVYLNGKLNIGEIARDIEEKFAEII